jgi:hypothetical protein
MGKILKTINIGDKISTCIIIDFISGNTSKTRLWKVKCECGSEYIEREETLKHQKPIICVCSKYKNILNSNIGNFFVKDFDIKTKKYLVKCICNKESYKSKYQLYNTESCGCLHEIDLTNKKYERLLFLEKVNKKWKCICDCGNVKYYSAKKFGCIKSCGCLVSEKAKETIEFAIAKAYKDDFRFLRKRYQGYSDGDISFDKFYELSQLNCHYCGSLPNNLCKSFNKRNPKDIYYNGLDRVDNNIGHYINNVVPCCIICNRAKADRTLNEFIDWVRNVYKRDLLPIKQINIEKFGLLKKDYYRNYTDGLSFQEFVNFSQMDCHYCGVKPLCIKKDIKWNGVDRINSKLDHNIINCVPCCKHCNFAKNNLNIDDFYEHIEKIKLHLNL